MHTYIALAVVKNLIAVSRLSGGKLVQVVAYSSNRASYTQSKMIEKNIFIFRIQSAISIQLWINNIQQATMN